MNTKFKLLFKNDISDIEIHKFKKSLPVYFSVTEEDGRIYVTIESEEDGRCQSLINQELDRYYFLTSVRIHAEMVRPIKTVSCSIAWDIRNDLPENVKPQVWNDKLPMQLKLWSIAVNVDDAPLKVILFYQIIELSGVGQNDSEQLIECKLLRDWVSHAGDIGNRKLKDYCQRLDIQESMLDRSNPEHILIVERKVSLLREEAKKIISISITKIM